ncbi:MAG: hypothetical protein HOW73_41100 [Polyangiaceae bacterium]|nr:hypothetical protein [Polyangiaceae bacterium]
MKSLTKAILVIALTPGCWDYCEENPAAPFCSQEGGGGSGGAPVGGNPNTGGAGGEQGGAGGTGGTVDPGCVPTEGEALGADCGVYVQLGATGAGTQAEPIGTINAAIGALGDKTRIYVCGEDVFPESVNLPAGVSLYGGFSCDGWTYSATNPKPTVFGAADTIALKIEGEGVSTVQSMRIQADDAATAGRSSIAMLVAQAQVDIVECEIVAGIGAEGAPGALVAKEPTPGAANGLGGMMGCQGSGTNLNGGSAGQLTCDASPRDGGDGGKGTTAGDGLAGIPGNPVGASNVGGKPETTMAPTACGNGGEGDPGNAGDPGLGASEDDLGQLTSTGFTGAAGQAGLSAGTHGQGGGGGGGANACGGAGPSGGGGGAGGCGGAAGAAGSGGGGSFALVSIDAIVTLTDALLTAAAGGSGGAGDAGQEGMDGGTGGNPGNGGGACSGGPGGKGGRGGAGGGGRGGPSVGIAYVGDAPDESGSVEITIAEAPAAGGDGGGGNVTGNGADGVHELRQEWP